MQDRGPKKSRREFGEVVQGLTDDLSHNERLRQEARRRAAERRPDSRSIRQCCKCGAPTRFIRINPTLTTQSWCEPCYLLATEKESQESKFLGQRTGLARHLARSPKRKPADDFERSQYGLD